MCCPSFSSFEISWRKMFARKKVKNATSNYPENVRNALMVKKHFSEQLLKLQVAGSSPSERIGQLVIVH